MKRNILVVCIVYILTPQCLFPALNTTSEYPWSIRIICGYNRSNSPIGNAFFFWAVYVYNVDNLCNCRIGNTSYMNLWLLTIPRPFGVAGSVFFFQVYFIKRIRFWKLQMNLGNISDWHSSWIVAFVPSSYGTLDSLRIFGPAESFSSDDVSSSMEMHILNFL